MPSKIIKREKQISVKFKPRARLLLQLGDQLIKNESIALIELVKNSYDADATIANINMENVDDPHNGIIIISDDGYGMDTNTVVNVWMEPGSDFKTEKFRKRELSPIYERLPIGEKGIGRFGAHKLGNLIEMTTKTKGSKEVFVKINWTVFKEYKYLDQVPVTIIEREKPLLYKNGKSGTNIIIRNLRKKWTRGIARNVKRSVTALTSPFETKSSFEASFKVLDKPEWFEGLFAWDDIKHYSLYNFKVIIKNDSISYLKYNFTPWSSMPKLSGRKIMFNKKSNKIKGLKKKEEKYLSLFSNLMDNEENSFTLNEFNIGEIIFEGYIFSHDNYILKLGVSDKKGFKEYLKSNSGIRVFRDGLRVYDYGEPENDWLGLDLRRVNQPGKRISNNIILGAVYLKRSESYDLVEKTNREGFVENKAYETFKNSILHAIELIEVFRFSDKQKLREIYGPTSKSEPVLQILGELQEYINNSIKEKEINKEITKYLIKIEEDYKTINENLLKAAGAGLNMSVIIHEVEKVILEIHKVLKKEKASKRALNLVQHLSSLIDGYAEIIKKSTKLKENLKEIIEQALFNTEYRLNAHKIEVIKAFKNSKSNSKIKVAKNLLIGSLMNLIDNSIYWLEKADRPQKKIYVGIDDEGEDFINIIYADNGCGFLLPTDEIIEPFVSAKPGGIGLGLHITSEVMLSQGGKLTFPDWGDYKLPNDFKEGAIIALGFNK